MQDVEGEGPGPWGGKPEDRGKEKRLAVHRNLPSWQWPRPCQPAMPRGKGGPAGAGVPRGAIPSAETVLSHACDKGYHAVI